MARPVFTRVLRLRLWLTERLRPGEALITLFWAGVVGAVGGLSAPAFRAASGLLQRLFTQSRLGLVEAAGTLPAWQRVLVPAVGGLIAGLVLVWGTRLVRGRRSTDFMEAIVLGDGVIKARPSLVRIVSSLFSIGSGGSIGREGPMVQLSSLIASAIGRFARFPRPRLRLLVACGAAAGIASAYNAPIGGTLFVAEIVLGSIAMETFGPLIFASVMATVVARLFFGEEPLFVVPHFRLVSYFELVPYVVLGAVTGLVAPWFLRLLQASTELFARWDVPIWVRMATGGLVVGLLSLHVPDVWGNGYDAVDVILSSNIVWKSLLVLLAFKLVATAATVGSGAVGGVFTPTLLVGAVIGALLGTLVHHEFPDSTAGANAYALVGMGAFLAGATHAPLMAILILYDMTRDYDIVLPLMLACVVAWSTARASSPDSIYAAALARRPAERAHALERMRVRDLMQPGPLCVLDDARFTEIVEKFVRNRHHNLYVVGAQGEFRGVIPLHEIKSFLNDPELGKLAIAQDLLREDFPTVNPDSTLREALDRFSTHPIERIPVLDGPDGRRLVGAISKTDLLLTLGGSR